MDSWVKPGRFRRSHLQKRYITTREDSSRYRIWERRSSYRSRIGKVWGSYTEKRWNWNKTCHSSIYRLWIQALAWSRSGTLRFLRFLNMRVNPYAHLIKIEEGTQEDRSFLIFTKLDQMIVAWVQKSIQFAASLQSSKWMRRRIGNHQT